MGLLINTSGTQQPNEIIATSGIKDVEVAPAWLSSGGEGELESLASFGQHGVEFDQGALTEPSGKKICASSVKIA